MGIAADNCSVLRLLLCVGVFTLWLSGCATTFTSSGLRVHEVRRGESIWMIARAYGVPVQELAEFNNIEDPNQIVAGRQLNIPGKQKKSGFKMFASGKRGGGRDSRTVARARGGNEPIHVDHSRFLWPVDGRVSSQFGMRDGRRHDGIDIQARDGAPIRAADSGKVVFAGEMRGYGQLILLRHSGDFFTAYAHNSKNKVKKDDVVKRGQVIGLVGRTGRATGPHLHFEVRSGQTARNPLFFLPKNGTAVATNEKNRGDHGTPDQVAHSGRPGLSKAGDRVQRHHSDPQKPARGRRGDG